MLDFACHKMPYQLMYVELTCQYSLSEFCSKQARTVCVPVNQFHLIIIGVGSNSILGGPNVIYTAMAAICAACMNINKFRE